MDKRSIYLHVSWPWWRRIFIGLNILALVLSIILSWHYLRGGLMIGCGAGSPCEQVLNSKWSLFAGLIPVSSLAAGVYMALLVSVLFIGPSADEQVRKIAWKTMLILSGAVAGSAIWFTILQKWFIGDYCPYCLSIHITGLLMASIIIWRALKESGGLKLSRLHMTGLTFAGLGLTVIMAVSQVIFTSGQVYQDGESLNYQPGHDYAGSPIVGSPDAPYIVNLLFDYQCPHCQKVHFMLDETVRRYNGKLAFALFPAPLYSECNPYVPAGVDTYKNSCELVRIGLAIWITNHEAFHEFENWMFTFDSGDAWIPRNIESAREKAVDLVGREKFETALTDPWIDQYIQKCTQVYGQTIRDGRGGIPKMIYGNRWVIPQPETPEDLILILQNSLALPEP